MPSLPNAAVRRFTVVRGVSLAVKVAAVALLLVIVIQLRGGL